MVQCGNSYAILPSNHELNHDLETLENNTLNYFWLNTVPVQGKKKVQDFLSFHEERSSQ